MLGSSVVVIQVIQILLGSVWMTLRETFITINASRAKGSRLTNIKIAINSQNTARYTHGSDFLVARLGIPTDPW